MFEYNTRQSWVEIEYYVAYFDRITAFKALYLSTSVKGRAQMNAATINTTTHRISALPLTEVASSNRRSEIQRFESSDAIKIHNEIMGPMPVYM